MTHKSKDYEYLIIRGCGGELQDFKNGFEEMFVENNVAPSGFKFDEYYSFEYDDLINIAFGLSSKDINMGRLAIVRLGWIENFGAMWLSDYYDNILIKDKNLNTNNGITEDDFKSYLEIQKSGVINMFDAKTGCELSGLDRETWISIQKNYEDLIETYKDVYQEIMNKQVGI